MSKGQEGESKTDVLQGTLDLMVLKTLGAMGPQHGFGLARRIDPIVPPTIVRAVTMVVARGGLEARPGLESFHLGRTQASREIFEERNR